MRGAAPSTRIGEKYSRDDKTGPEDWFQHLCRSPDSEFNLKPNPAKVKQTLQLYEKSYEVLDGS
jgi:hypothetical protein